MVSSPDLESIGPDWTIFFSHSYLVLFVVLSNPHPTTRCSAGLVRKLILRENTFSVNAPQGQVLDRDYV